MKVKVNVLNYSESGIWGSVISCFSSIFSKTEVVGKFFWDDIVNRMLVTINNVAIIAVALVKKFPFLLSFETCV